MKIVEWSIYEEFASATKPPDGLECALGCSNLALLYVKSSSVPSSTLLNASHPDVLSSTTVRNRTVGVLVAKILAADFLDPDWRFRFEYDEAAVLSGTLLPTQICEAKCFTCSRQGDAAFQGWTSGVSLSVSDDGAYLIASSPSGEIGKIPLVE